MDTATEKVLLLDHHSVGMIHVLRVSEMYLVPVYVTPRCRNTLAQKEKQCL
jgi:hypothetical protein